MFLVIGLFSGKGGEAVLEDVGKILQHARKAGDVGLARSGKAEQEKASTGEGNVLILKYFSIEISYYFYLWLWFLVDCESSDGEVFGGKKSREDQDASAEEEEEFSP